MRKNKKKNVTTIEIPEGNRVYNFNGVFYLVQSRFGKDSEHSIQRRFGRMIENISPAHLTEENEDDKIKVEYVLDTAGEESQSIKRPKLHGKI